MATIKTIRKAVEKFNTELEACYNKTEDRSLYEIDTTIIGAYRELEPAIITDRPDGGIDVELDALTYEIYTTYDDDDPEHEYPYIKDWDHGYDNLKDALAFYRRMIRKTLRIWYSENPDSEMEKDDSED